MFTDEFRREIELGKYTKWATYLRPEDLLGLLWALGEYMAVEHEQRYIGMHLKTSC
jgi:hypothetical protein